MESRIAWLPLFPGQSAEILKRILDWNDLKGLVLSTYGSGNAPTDTELKTLLSEANNRGLASSMCPNAAMGLCIPNGMLPRTCSATVALSRAGT